MRGSLDPRADAREHSLDLSKGPSVDTFSQRPERITAGEEVREIRPEGKAFSYLDSGAGKSTLTEQVIYPKGCAGWQAKTTNNNGRRECSEL